MADALDHCSINVALYGARHSRWAMTERGRSQVERSADVLAIGRSNLQWRGGTIEWNFDEICTPLPRRMRGTLRVHPECWHERSYPLHEDGGHLWTPYAPRARVELSMQYPDLTWVGNGYFDHNRGASPLEDAFDEWTWSRTSYPQRTLVTYDVAPRARGSRSLALQFKDGLAAEPIEIETLPSWHLPRTRWGLSRKTRAEPEALVRVVRTLEDAPFYNRSELEVQHQGSRAPAIHESLSLRRFRSRWVQCLLPFRMPRNTRS